MYHLSIEKSLKGLCQNRSGELPPKTHNLVYLVNRVEIDPPEKIGKFLVRLNQAHIVTRYPEDLEQLIKQYPKGIVAEILAESREALTWVKKQLQKF